MNSNYRSKTKDGFESAYNLKGTAIASSISDLNNIERAQENSFVNRYENADNKLDANANKLYITLCSIGLPFSNPALFEQKNDNMPIDDSHQFVNLMIRILFELYGSMLHEIRGTGVAFAKYPSLKRILPADVRIEPVILYQNYFYVNKDSPPNGSILTLRYVMHHDIRSAVWNLTENDPYSVVLTPLEHMSQIESAPFVMDMDEAKIWNDISKEQHIIKRMYFLLRCLTMTPIELLTFLFCGSEQPEKVIKKIKFKPVKKTDSVAQQDVLDNHYLVFAHMLKQGLSHLAMYGLVNAVFIPGVSDALSSRGTDGVEISDLLHPYTAAMLLYKHSPSTRFFIMSDTMMSHMNGRKITSEQEFILILFNEEPDEIMSESKQSSSLKAAFAEHTRYSQKRSAYNTHLKRLKQYEEDRKSGKVFSSEEASQRLLAEKVARQEVNDFHSYYTMDNIKRIFTNLNKEKQRQIDEYKLLNEQVQYQKCKINMTMPNTTNMRRPYYERLSPWLEIHRKYPGTSDTACNAELQRLPRLACMNHCAMSIQQRLKLKGVKSSFGVEWSSYCTKRAEFKQQLIDNIRRDTKKKDFMTNPDHFREYQSFIKTRVHSAIALAGEVQDGSIKIQDLGDLYQILVEVAYSGFDSMQMPVFNPYMTVADNLLLYMESLLGKEGNITFTVFEAVLVTYLMLTSNLTFRQSERLVTIIFGDKELGKSFLIKLGNSVVFFKKVPISTSRTEACEYAPKSLIVYCRLGDETNEYKPGYIYMCAQDVFKQQGIHAMPDDKAAALRSSNETDMQRDSMVQPDSGNTFRAGGYFSVNLGDKLGTSNACSLQLEPPLQSRIIPINYPKGNAIDTTAILTSNMNQLNSNTCRDNRLNRLWKLITAIFTMRESGLAHYVEDCWTTAFIGNYVKSLTGGHDSTFAKMMKQKIMDNNNAVDNPMNNSQGDNKSEELKMSRSDSRGSLSGDEKSNMGLASRDKRLVQRQQEVLSSKAKKNFDELMDELLAAKSLSNMINHHSVSNMSQMRADYEHHSKLKQTMAFLRRGEIQPVIKTVSGGILLGLRAQSVVNKFMFRFSLVSSAIMISGWNVLGFKPGQDWFDSCIARFADVFRMDVMDSIKAVNFMGTYNSMFEDAASQIFAILMELLNRYYKMHNKRLEANARGYFIFKDFFVAKETKRKSTRRSVGRPRKTSTPTYGRKNFVSSKNQQQPSNIPATQPESQPSVMDDRIDEDEEETEDVQMTPEQRVKYFFYIGRDLFNNMWDPQAMQMMVAYFSMFGVHNDLTNSVDPILPSEGFCGMNNDLWIHRNIVSMIGVAKTAFNEVVSHNSEIRMTLTGQPMMHPKGDKVERTFEGIIIGPRTHDTRGLAPPYNKKNFTYNDVFPSVNSQQRRESKLYRSKSGGDMSRAAPPANIVLSEQELLECLDEKYQSTNLFSNIKEMVNLEGNGVPFFLEEAKRKKKQTQDRKLQEEKARQHPLVIDVDMESNDKQMPSPTSTVGRAANMLKGIHIRSGSTSAASSTSSSDRNGGTANKSADFSFLDVDSMIRHQMRERELISQFREIESQTKHSNIDSFVEEVKQTSNAAKPAHKKGPTFTTDGTGKSLFGAIVDLPDEKTQHINSTNICADKTAITKADSDVETIPFWQQNASVDYKAQCNEVRRGILNLAENDEDAFDTFDRILGKELDASYGDNVDKLLRHETIAFSLFNSYLKVSSQILFDTNRFDKFMEMVRHVRDNAHDNRIEDMVKEHIKMTDIFGRNMTTFPSRYLVLKHQVYTKDGVPRIMFVDINDWIVNIDSILYPPIFSSKSDVVMQRLNDELDVGDSSLYYNAASLDFMQSIDMTKMIFTRRLHLIYGDNYRYFITFDKNIRTIMEYIYRIGVYVNRLKKLTSFSSALVDGETNQLYFIQAGIPMQQEIKKIEGNNLVLVESEDYIHTENCNAATFQIELVSMLEIFYQYMMFYTTMDGLECDCIDNLFVRGMAANVGIHWFGSAIDKLVEYIITPDTDIDVLLVKVRKALATYATQVIHADPSSSENAVNELYQVGYTHNGPASENLSQKQKDYITLKRAFDRFEITNSTMKRCMYVPLPGDIPMTTEELVTKFEGVTELKRYTMVLDEKEEKKMLQRCAHHIKVNREELPPEEKKKPGRPSKKGEGKKKGRKKKKTEEDEEEEDEDEKERNERFGRNGLVDDAAYAEDEEEEGESLGSEDTPYEEGDEGEDEESDEIKDGKTSPSIITDENDEQYKMMKGLIDLYNIPKSAAVGHADYQTPANKAGSKRKRKMKQSTHDSLSNEESNEQINYSVVVPAITNDNINSNNVNLNGNNVNFNSQNPDFDI